MGAIAMLSGCRLDMHTDPKIQPLTKSDFYSDGRSARSLVPGTIARGQLRSDTYLYTGMIDGKPGDFMPFPATRQVLERGRQRFDIFCAPCHSEIGDGNGMIVQRGYRHPPSFHTPALRQAPLGHFYDVITNGFGAMPDYAEQIPSTDRWAIAAYIRVLQLSQDANTADVPPGTKMPDMVAEPQTTPGSGATLPPGAAPGGVLRPNGLEKKQ